VEVSVEDAVTHQALATEVSEVFWVDGPFDLKRGYEGVIRVRPRWRFE